jgi:hypothetical protein
MPVHLFTELKEIDFEGAKFYVPNPPEEYLSMKYGRDWRIPKKAGFEKDVLDLIPREPIPGNPGILKQVLAQRFMPWRTTRIKVLSSSNKPVADAEIFIAGVGCFRTNKLGYAKFYLPRDDFYAVVVKYDNHEEILYEEKMMPGKTYIYKPDIQVTTGRYFVLVTVN